MCTTTQHRGLYEEKKLSDSFRLTADSVKYSVKSELHIGIGYKKAYATHRHKHFVIISCSLAKK